MPATDTISVSWWSTRSPSAMASVPGGGAFRALRRKGRSAAERVLLLLPGTYMNESGRAVADAAISTSSGFPISWCFTTRSISPPAKVRVKTGGGIAGHNGLRSISAHIGNDYRRVRIGVGHPGVKELVHAHVLDDFARDERPWVEACASDHRRQCRSVGEGPGCEPSRTRCISPCKARASGSCSDRPIADLQA